MKRLELLAPARNADIGIAAIDCGADAVYIAAPRFGARQAAGNDMEDIARLCTYAHGFGARIFVTLNTILYDDEIEEAERTLHEVQEAGVDAVIVQDMAVLKMARKPGLPLHASTQCAIRTPEKASILEKAGFSRLILERELSLEQIKAISDAVHCEIECFVHGALCVCYSGQCYLSEKIAGRSANRGGCIQACRSRYDLTDASGNVLARNKALLSLKDFNLIGRLEDLVHAGVTSFKIEGRLKNMSYVRNVVRDYSMALDRIIARPENAGKLSRASYGHVEGGFTPDTSKTFNRGYTELFLDGKRGQWAAMDAAKSMGEELGTVTALNRSRTSFTIRPAHKSHLQDKGRPEPVVLNNGDGLSFVSRDREVSGVRADVCNGMTVQCKATPGLYEGAVIFRSYNIAFEKKLENSPCRRLIDVNVSIRQASGPSLAGTPAGCSEGRKLEVTAASEDGRKVSIAIPEGITAENQDRMKAMFRTHMSKTSGHYSFHTDEMPGQICLPLLPASALNAIRREIAGKLDKIPCNAAPLYNSEPSSHNEGFLQENEDIEYRDNVSNRLAETYYSEAGLLVREKAYELTHRHGVELMRTRYCIRYELGLCPKYHHCKDSGPLFLTNNGQRFRLEFDCRNCEMTVSE